MKFKLTSIISLVCVFSATLAQASAIRAIEFIDLSGNDMVTDSFDSADPAHSDNGGYPFSHPENVRSNGDVLTISTSVNAISVGNANIKGRVGTGPNGSVSVGPFGWVTGGIFNSVNFACPEVSIPPDFNAGGIIYNNLTVHGKTYSKAIVSSGDYVLTSLSGTLYIGSNITCRIKITSSVSLGLPSSEIRVSSGARVKIYMIGASFSLGGSGIVNENSDPDSFNYFGLPSNTSVTLSAAATDFTGCIYAPQASFVTGGSDNTIRHFVGSLTAKRVHLNGRVYFHFDENLYRVGSYPPTFTTHPKSQTILPGRTATFVSVALGQGTLGYQWHFSPYLSTNRVVIPDATNATLTVANPGLSEAGSYWVVATNELGSANSNPALLKVALTPTLSVTAASPFQFSVIGVNGLTYAVESSTNFSDWERVITNTAPFSITDTNLDALPQRFYRAVYLP